MLKHAVALMHSLHIINDVHVRLQQQGRMWFHRRPADSLSVTPINDARPPSGPCPPVSSLGQWKPARRQSCRDDPRPMPFSWSPFRFLPSSVSFQRPFHSLGISSPPTHANVGALWAYQGL